MKKIIIWVFILFSIFFWSINESNSEAQCSWENSLCSSDFTISTTELWLWWNNINQWWTSKDTLDNWLKVIVEKLMIAFWVLSLWIMTIGWGYMIFAAGQDELLNKWKSIFNSWLIALLVALASWIIMKLIIYLLYP